MKGTVRWHISCDESGIGGARYYGFGSLWMKWQRRGQFFREIDDLLVEANYPGEVKWNKCNDRKKLKAHKQLIEYFFKRQWLAFHCIVIRKAIVDKALNKGSYDVARRKHFVMLLSKKVAASIKAHENRQAEYRVWVDKIPSEYAKADEEAEVIANNLLAQELQNIRPIESVITKDSKDAYQIQLCDLLLGSVMEAWQGKSTSIAKAELLDFVAEHLGWSDLKSDTWPNERKFNIWYFKPKTYMDREIDTRKVTLKYPYK